MPDFTGPTTGHADTYYTNPTGQQTPSVGAEDQESAPTPATIVTSYSQQTTTPYTQYLIDTKYELHTGLYQQPVQGPPGTPCAILGLHAPYMTKTVKWTAERLGDKPVPPYWSTGNGNEVLQYRSITPASPLADVSGTGRIWRASGLYKFLLYVPLADAASLHIGAPPCDSAPAELQVIDGTLFDPNILRASY